MAGQQGGGGQDPRHPKSRFGAKYPYNRVEVTESGHERHYDDTPGKERIREAHKSGTYYEVSPDGKRVDQIVGNKISYVKGGQTNTVDGSNDSKIHGGDRSSIGGDRHAEVKGSQTDANHGHRKNISGGDQAQAINGDRSVGIRGNETTKIGKNNKHKVDGDSKSITDGTHDTEIGGAASLTGKSTWTIKFDGKIMKTSAVSITLSGGGSTIDIRGGGITITSPDNKTVGITNLDNGGSPVLTVAGPSPTVFAKPSDRRLKKDIVRVGETVFGLPLYRYKYVWGETEWVGVMAQEVALVAPDCVMYGTDGYMMVDYRALGVPFITYEEWNAQIR